MFVTVYVKKCNFVLTKILKINLNKSIYIIKKQMVIMFWNPTKKIVFNWYEGCNRMTKISDNFIRISKHIGFLFLLLFFVFCFVGNVIAQNNDELFLSGNQLYQQEKYEEAIENYEQILKRNFESAQLYYNLGNAYFRVGNIGRCILNYERAQKLAPLDDDIRYNLQIANSYTDKIEAPARFFLIEIFDDMVEFLRLKLNLDDFTKLVVGIYIVFILLIILRLALKNEAIRKKIFYLIIPIFILFILSVVALQVQIYARTNVDEAIILVEEVEVIGSPEESAKQLFTLHEGTKVIIENSITKSEKVWLEVKLADGKTGWITSTALERI